MTKSTESTAPLYPQDIIDDADSREPWPSQLARDWYMEGRMVERESNAQDRSSDA